MVCFPQLSEKENANRMMQARLDAIYQRQKPHYQLDYDSGILHARTHMHDLRSRSRAQQQSSVTKSNQIYKQRLAAVKAYYSGPQRKANNTNQGEKPERRRSEEHTSELQPLMRISYA